MNLKNPSQFPAAPSSVDTRLAPGAGHRMLRVNILNLAFACLGGLINIFSYGSVAPVVVAAIFFGVFSILLALTPLGGVPERRMFNRVFSIGFLMAGIAAVYANQFQDEGQLYSDAGGFFEMATGGATGVSLIDLRILSEGSLGIILWRSVYDFFASIGFEKARYVGIAVNVAAIALTGVIGIKIARQLFGEDAYRFRRMTLLVASCGLFWLFASIHLRDSLIVLAVTALVYIWQHFLAKPDVGLRLLQVVFWNVLASIFFGFLRREFALVPLAMGIAAVMGLYLGRAERGRHVVVYSLMMIGCAALVILVAIYADEIGLAVGHGYMTYGEQVSEQSGANSLGMVLIVKQIIPIRLVLGSIYLFVFPIPFWSGFQLESAYSLFKSTNVVFFYFVLPLLFLTLRDLMRHRNQRTPAIVFLVFLGLGATLSVAGTSLETRHFGAFLIPLLALATVPDLRTRRNWYRYKVYLSVVLCGVFMVHVTWLVLKVL